MKRTINSQQKNTEEPLTKPDYQLNKNRIHFVSSLWKILTGLFIAVAIILIVWANFVLNAATLSCYSSGDTQFRQECFVSLQSTFVLVHLATIIAILLVLVAGGFAFWKAISH